MRFAILPDLQKNYSQITEFALHLQLILYQLFDCIARSVVSAEIFAGFYRLLNKFMNQFLRRNRLLILHGYNFVRLLLKRKELYPLD